MAIRQDWGEGAEGRVGCPDVSELRKCITKSFEYQGVLQILGSLIDNSIL